MQNLALYIHWPFCLSKCPYCDFNSHLFDGVDEDRWLKAYFKEMDYYKDRLSERKLVSIFFGGGTPSLMSAGMVESIIKHADNLWGIDRKTEITLEANPTSFEAKKFKDFKNAGVNRASIGIQALNDKDLKFLGREHSVAEAMGALDKAASIFDNYTFDLIYARPNQTVEAWGKELEQAVKLIAGHISLYQLTIEKGTPFYNAHKNGEFELPNEEDSARMYELTAKILGKENLYPYEISNYAKYGFESKHNLAYWHYQEYLGIGAGAHSRLRTDGGREAIVNHHLPQKWLESVEKDANSVQNSQAIVGDDMVFEMVMMGLRTASGISKEYFESETGRKIHSVLNDDDVMMLKGQGLLEEDEHFLRLTRQGFLLHQAIINQILT